MCNVLLCSSAIRRHAVDYQQVGYHSAWRFTATATARARASGANVFLRLFCIIIVPKYKSVELYALGFHCRYHYQTQTPLEKLVVDP